MLTMLEFLWLTIFLGLSAWQDIKTRTISNDLIFTGFMGVIILQTINQTWHGFSVLIGIIVSFGLWRLKFIGGGDSKLLMMVSFAFPPRDLYTLYLYISLAGALQALYFVTLKKETSLPYAVAILGGTLLFLILKIWP
jgi:prepilin peptidase CpaA